MDQNQKGSDSETADIEPENLKRSIQPYEKLIQDNFLYLNKKIEKLEKRVAFLEGKGYTQEPEVTVVTVATAAEKVVTGNVVAEKVAAEASRETYKPTENLGFKVFGAVGFVLIMLGMFYLYSYAVDQGWIGILERVALGVAFSLVVLVIGEIFRRKEYERFSQLITGGGISLLYFTMYATYHFQAYREALSMSLGMNTALLFLVMLFAVFLALRQNSVILTSFAFFLGYLAAFLTGGSHQMMISTIILSAGLVMILWKKKWGIGLYPVVASYLLYSIFFFDSNILREAVVSPIVYYAIVYLICFFALFNILSIILEDKENYSQNIISMVINAFATFGFVLAVVWDYWYSFRGIFVILLAAVYFGLAYFTKKRELKNLSRAFFILCITFLSIAVYVQLEDFWIALTWAIEGFLLVYMGVKLHNLDLRYMGYIVLAAAATRSLLWDSTGLLFGERTISMLSITLALYGAAYLVSHVKLDDEEQLVRELLGIAATVILTLALATEITDSTGLFAAFSENARQVLLSVVWATESVILIVVGFLGRSSSLRSTGVVLFGITVVKILIIDLSNLEMLYRIFVTIIVGLIALSASFAYVKNKERIQGFLQEND
ncbi:DUF2339 domain-containing protein [Methanococcoides methylutens]|uniref:DUF2339 domain-containing protein n=1 Tax=Methanococcoides methylutens MM1 TaxID=1434104 RepID=A0A0E3X159_METMT|nr:DUF2339 domain-containing protein [Methanococcoides methylutens]AKB84909.1 hypothetical protein MCMEM_0856 [Methanococcoides methylutens MM1]